MPKAHFEYEGKAELTKRNSTESSVNFTAPLPEVLFDVNTEYLPGIEDNYVTVCSTKKTRINPRMLGIMDCGFTFANPAGFKAVFEVYPKWAEKGAIAKAIDYKSYVKVAVYNCGKEILSFEEGEFFAKLWFYPIQKIAAKFNIKDK